MVPGPPAGAALLVDGFDLTGAPGRSESVVQILGQVGEALLATAVPWRIRRLSPTSGQRYTPDKATLKSHIVELTQEPVAVVVLVVVGTVARVMGEPALVAGTQYREFPEDVTVPLAWIRDRLLSCRAHRVLVAVSARSDGEPHDEAGAWLDALATRSPAHVVAVHSSSSGSSMLDALLAGFCGAAIDPGTGTITLRSIGEHLARSIPTLAIQPSLSSEPIVHPPPLRGLWDIGLTQTRQTQRGHALASLATGAPEDMIDVILPGRFRIERVLAKGSFGVVYRARQLTVERDVAIKLLQPGIDPASKNGRLFVHEIQSVGRLDHPNVVRIYQADIAPDGRLFFAMELLVGRDLQQIMNDEGSLAPERAVALTRQLLAGLGAAHDAGLVHADVKPANAFLVAARDHERLVLLDFGLARLRPPGSAAESAGGTPAYMPPEQLNDGRVDARSDLFSAALVLVTLLTGWRRTRAEELIPPMDDIPGPGLRAVLSRALALDPADRFQTAADFADALAGKPATEQPAVATRSPFRHLAPLTEDDRGRLYGRDRDVAVLTEHVLYRRAVIYTAPSGTGKTSLLRAGLVPRLETLGVRTVYLSCRPGADETLALAIWPGVASVAEAIRSWHDARGGKLVVILDQLELLLSERPRETTPSREGASHDVVGEALGFKHWPAEADVSVVLSVREDFLARLIEWTQRLEPALPVLRLGPLGPDGAREAIAGPLAEARLAIAPSLLDALLCDLESAAAAIGSEMGWGARPAVYPPHLQLACSVLCDAMRPGEVELTLAHYRQLGGLDAIVGEYLDRVLDTELDAESSLVARDLFLALVTSAHTRAMRSEAELVDMVSVRHAVQRTLSVLQVLQARGLLVRVPVPGGEPGWELVHDSLVSRVLGWIDRRDLARRRVLELVRHHLRRSRPGVPSLLDRAELREVRAHPDAVPELDAEWDRRRDGAADAWKPSSLVERSRRTVSRSNAIIATAATVLIAGGGIVWSRSARERQLRELDIGRFRIEISAFDWDPLRLETVPVPVKDLPDLRWELHEPDRDDPYSPGPPLPEYLAARGAAATAPDGRSLTERLEARAGAAFLVASGRGRQGESCAPSIVPIRQLPGYAQREHDEVILSVVIPTCRATRAGTISIPAGSFVHGGLGEPLPDPIPPALSAYAGVAPERQVVLPAYSIDRTEVTNAAFSVFARMQLVTGLPMPEYPPSAELQRAEGAAWPASGISWSMARAYCRFIGKSLPTAMQWEKAMRGALVLPGGMPNPMPRRDFPWGVVMSPAPAKLFDTGAFPGPAPAGSTPGDMSPYGVLDLAGNVTEWTDTIMSSPKPLHGFHVVRGGNWADTTSSGLAGYTAIDNDRPIATQTYDLGLRCVSTSD